MVLRMDVVNCFTKQGGCRAVEGQQHVIMLKSKRQRRTNPLKDSAVREGHFVIIYNALELYEALWCCLCNLLQALNLHALFRIQAVFVTSIRPFLPICIGSRETR